MLQWNNPGSALLEGMLQSQRNQQLLNHGKTVNQVLTSSAPAADEPAGAVPQPARRPRPLPLKATDFQAKQGPLVPKRFADQIPGATTEQRQGLIFACDTYLGEYEKVGRRNNVATALTYLLAAGLFVIQDGEELEDKVQDRVVRQLNDLLGAALAFTRLSAQDRQMLYESAVIAGGFTMSFYAAALQSGDSDQVLRAKALAQSLVSQMFGRPMESIHVTSDGVAFD